MVKGGLVCRSVRRPTSSDNSVRSLTPLGLRVAIFVFLATATATAAPPPNADPALGSWFRSLTDPIFGMSCCAEADGHILSDSDWRANGDHYEIRVAGSWWPVPPESVLNHVPNPTGGAVVFWEPHHHASNPAPHIYCFVRPVEG